VTLDFERTEHSPAALTP